ncbi:hypothetical protein N7456_003966 [Penicillium angulare]|uniref:Uncharacterized protein n=1 Tax=Penicillium angulare TaxID=116970 RepID=A0A9W9FVL6_9EURO|nr:hypothetical protein N7456_003966 [Penicillium angulare]
MHPNVTTTASQMSMATIFPLSCDQSFAAKINCVRVSNPKQPIEQLATSLRSQFITALGRNLLFKGITRQVLRSFATFSLSAISHIAEDEFGPGFYKTPHLEHALRYGGCQGVLLVFKDLDTHNLSTLDLQAGDWDVVVRFWTNMPVSELENRIPPLWRNSDLLEGPTSILDHCSQKKTPGPERQVVGVSKAALAHVQHLSLRCI